MADDMQVNALNPQLLLQPRLQLAQSLIQQGTDTSPIRSPWQGVARLGQVLAGNYIQGKTNEQYGALQKDANDQLSAASKSADPMSAIANSSNPLLRAMLPGLVQKQLENNLTAKMKNLEPVNLKTGEVQQIKDANGNVINTITNPNAQTELGKYIAARDALAPNDPIRSLYDTQIGKMGQEGGITFGPNGAAPVPGVGAAKANLASALLPVELQKAAGEANIRAATTPTNVTVGNRADVPVSQAAAIAMGQAPGQPGAAFAPNGIPGIQPITAPPPMTPQQIPAALNAMPQNPAGSAPQQMQQPAMPSGIGPQATGGVPKIQPEMPPQTGNVATQTMQTPMVGRPFYTPEQQSEGTKTGDNVAEAAKTLNVMAQNLPVLQGRINAMSDANKSSTFGPWNDEAGHGLATQYADFRNNPASVANAKLQQLTAQNILPELGPQLAQAGIRGNKFLEQLSSQSSGVDLGKGQDARQAQIDGLLSNYIQNMKSTYNQVKQYGGDPSTVFANADSVKNAYNLGILSKDDAAQILRKNHGFQ